MESINETWRIIAEFSNYEVSNTGKVRSIIHDKVLRPSDNRGYERVRLYRNGEVQSKFVHQLVAEAFLDDRHDELEINHIDGNKKNNSIDNLEWCTHRDNMKHAFDTGLKTPSGGLPNRRLRVVETDVIYESAYDCARDMHLDQAHINHCLMGKRNRHGGYHFEYVDE